jgi:hypothetical protein
MPRKISRKTNNKRTRLSFGQRRRFSKTNANRLSRNSRSSLSTSVQQRDIADRNICNVAVSEWFNDNPSSTNQTYTWIANGLFDPLGTSGSAQPSWFQPWMAMYAKYKVISSSIQLQCTNTTNDPMEIVVYPTLVTAPLSTVVGAKTQPFSTSKLIGPSSGSSNGVIRNFIVSSKLFGRNVMGDETFAGNIGTNPASKWYWQIFCTSLSSDYIEVNFVLTMRFKVIFYGRLTQDLTTPSLNNYYKQVLLEHKERNSNEGDLDKYKSKLLDILKLIKLDEEFEQVEKKIEEK